MEVLCRLCRSLQQLVHSISSVKYTYGGAGITPALNFIFIRRIDIYYDNNGEYHYGRHSDSSESDRILRLQRDYEMQSTKEDKFWSSLEIHWRRNRGW